MAKLEGVVALVTGAARKRGLSRVGSDFASVRQQMRDAIPMGRQGQPDEQAAVVSFLIGPEA